MSTENNPIELLNKLLEKNYDAEQGYKNAAEDVDNTLLKEFLNNNSQLRYDFGHEIKDEIRKLGGEPEKGTSLTGDLHRKWMDLRSALSMNNDKAVIAECEKGEKASLQDYEDALKSDSLPDSAKTVVMNHYEKIKSALVKLENLEAVIEKQ